MSMQTVHVTDVDSVNWRLYHDGIVLAYQQFSDSMYEHTGELYSDDESDLVLGLKNGHAISVMVEHGHKVVGMAMHHHVGGRVSLDVLWIRSKYRGLGLPALLMNSVANYYERMIAGNIEMEVDVPVGCDELVDYYKERGFGVVRTTLVKNYSRTRTIDCTEEDCV